MGLSSLEFGACFAPDANSSKLSQAKKSQYTVYVCLLLTTLETAESASQCAGPVQHSRYAFERSLNPWVLNGADSISHAQSSGIPEKDSKQKGSLERCQESRQDMSGNVKAGKHVDFKGTL